MKPPHLPLNRERLALLYDFLAECPPFDRWNMPDSDTLMFTVTREKRTLGYYRKNNGKHEIGISTVACGWMNSVVQVMAHEMVHLHQAVAGMETPHTEHNAAFIKLAHQVCQFHGYDPHEFC